MPATFSDGRARPGLRVAEQRVDSCLRREVGVVVGQQLVVVATPQQRIDHAAVACRLVRREGAAADGLQHRLQARVPVVDAQRLVAAFAQRRDLVRTVAEDEDVFVADALADLDVGAVVGADGQRAVQRELHVAGARGLGAGGGDLLRQVGAGHDELGHRHAVVRHEHHLQPAAQARVVVDHLADVVDQPDDLLGHVVARRGLAGEDHGARHPVALRVGQDVLVARHHVQQVEQLPLVFVDALDLHVEQAVRIDLQADGRGNVLGQALLVGQLDGEEFVAERGVFGQRPQPAQLVQVEPPAVADVAVDQPAQPRVGMGQPAPRRDAVGHVGEALGPQAGEVGEDGLDQQLGVQRRDAVDLVAADDGQVGHAHAALARFVDQRQPAQELRRRPGAARPRSRGSPG